MISIFPKNYPEYKEKLKGIIPHLGHASMNLIRKPPNKIAPSIQHFPAQNQGDAPRPAILVIPGGGYFARDVKWEGTDTAAFFNALGFEAFILHYSISPYSYPAPIIEGRRALQYLHYRSDELNIDKNKIGVIGYSAGGHLASVIGSKIQGKNESYFDEIDKQVYQLAFQILCYPVIDIHEKSAALFTMRKMAFAPDLSQYEADEMDASLLIHKNTPPTFIWHSEKDRTIAKRHSEIYIEKLKENGVPFKSFFPKDGGHGVGLANRLWFPKREIGRWTEELRAWLREVELVGRL